MKKERETLSRSLQTDRARLEGVNKKLEGMKNRKVVLDQNLVEKEEALERFNQMISDSEIAYSKVNQIFNRS